MATPYRHPVLRPSEPTRPLPLERPRPPEEPATIVCVRDAQRAEPDAPRYAWLPNAIFAGIIVVTVLTFVLAFHAGR